MKNIYLCLFSLGTDDVIVVVSIAHPSGSSRNHPTQFKEDVPRLEFIN